MSTLVVSEADFFGGSAFAGLPGLIRERQEVASQLAFLKKGFPQYRSNIEQFVETNYVLAGRVKEGSEITKLLMIQVFFYPYKNSIFVQRSDDTNKILPFEGSFQGGGLVRELTDLLACNHWSFYKGGGEDVEVLDIEDLEAKKLVSAVVGKLKESISKDYRGFIDRNELDFEKIRTLCAEKEEECDELKARALKGSLACLALIVIIGLLGYEFYKENMTGDRNYT